MFEEQVTYTFIFFYMKITANELKIMVNTTKILSYKEITMNDLAAATLPYN